MDTEILRVLHEARKISRGILSILSGKHVRVMNTPLYPTLYSKTGLCRGIPIFLFLFQNIDCGYLLEPPRL